MVIDIIWGLLLAYGFYLGFSKGIISTVFTLMSFVFGVIAAAKFGPAFTKLLTDVSGSDNPLMFIAGSLGAFLLTMILIRMLARGLEGLLQTANVNIFNQILGAFVMMFLLTFVFSWLVLFAERSRLIDEQTQKQSISYSFLEHFPEKAKVVGDWLEPVFKEFWDHSLNFMDDLQDLSDQNTDTSTNIYDIED